jgi:hypothetical protein
MSVSGSGIELGRAIGDSKVAPHASSEVRREGTPFSTSRHMTISENLPQTYDISA